MSPNIKPLLAASFALLTWNAQAVEPPAATVKNSTASGKSSTLTAPLAWDAPVATSRLGTLRGGTSLSANVAQSGSVQGNTTNNVSAGANSVGGGSFANASGLPTVIQNSGANVVIQNSTVINILFKP